MVYLKLPTFKTGVNPTIRAQYDMNNLAPSQKLDLVRCRIFGTNIGTNHHSGHKEFFKTRNATKRYSLFKYHLADPQGTFKYYQDLDKEEWEDHLVEGRKFRIMMRGIKIGRRKGGGRVSLLNIFETSDSK